MKIVKDERLFMKNLKNIRFAFVFQTLCIVGILIYEGIVKGFLHITDHPLWLVFIGTFVLLGYLNLRISVDEYESHNAKKPGPYYKNLILALTVAIVFCLISLFSPGGTLRQSIIIGVVMFICFIIPYSYVYYLRKKRYKENNEDDE